MLELLKGLPEEKALHCARFLVKKAKLDLDYSDVINYMIVKCVTG